MSLRATAMRIVIFGGAAIALGALLLEARRRSRRAFHTIRSATERWEDEGGALRGRRD